MDPANGTKLSFAENCRICLADGPNLTPISALEDQTNLTKLLIYFNISEFEDPRYPNGVCISCLAILNKTVKFRETCERSSQFVHEILLKYDEDAAAAKVDQNEIFVVTTEENIKDEVDADHNAYDAEDGDDPFQDNGASDNDDEESCDDEFIAELKTEPAVRKTRNYNRSCKSRPDTSRPYQCKFCQKTFGWKKVLVNHLRIHTGEKPFTCTTCDKQFGAASALAYHRKHVHEEKPETNPADVERQKYFCTDCKKYFTLQNSLNIHRKKYHTETQPLKTECKVCGHAVNNIYSHMKNKHSEPEYKCPYNCSKAFPYKSGLLKHIEFIHEKSAVSFKCLCTACGKAFRTNGELKLHTKVKHSDERNYKCKYCDRRFKTSSHSLQHEKSTHLDERAHKCSFCPKAFTTKRILVSHVRIHTGEKPYVCNICSRAFTQNGALKTHTRLVHGQTHGR